MKKKYVVISCILIYNLISCSNKSYIIIRHNFFNSKTYKLSIVDTNKVNMWFYKSLLEQRHVGDSLLLYEVHGNYRIVEDFGLFDIKSNEFLYASAENKDGFKFIKDTSLMYSEIHSKTKLFIDKNEDSLLQMVINAKPSQITHSNNYKISIIKILSKTKAFVKTYHL